MAEKRILPLPPFLRFLFDVPSVANAEITSQATLMALDKFKDKDKKTKEKVSGIKDQEPETPSEPPEGPKEPMTGLPYDILGELFDIAKDVSKMSSGDEEKTKTVEIQVEEKKEPITVTYTLSGKPITDQDLAEEVSKLSTEQLNKERRYYLNAFNDNTSAYGPGRYKMALDALPTMPQGLTLRDFMSPKYRNKINVNSLRMHGAHARLDAIMDELRKREDFDPSAVVQESFSDLLSTSSENLSKIKEAEKQVKYFRDRGLDEEADKLENQIADFKKRNNI
tara:strand:+ start:4479 stop:5321 length:843 start_codon:yes stop_codon:yes gene_type:complete